MPKTLRVWLVRFLLVFLCAVFVTMGIPFKAKRTAHGTAFTMMKAINLINPHESFETRLRIQGRNFKGLMGELPFYMETSDGNHLFFVTEPGPIWHFYNIGDKTFNSVNAHRSASVGYTIGAKQPRESVSVNGNAAIVTLEYYSYQAETNETAIYTVDMGQGEITSCYIYQINGNVTNSARKVF